MNHHEVDTFLTQEKCDRCNKKLTVRTTSWFTEETICPDCSAKERKLKDKMRKQGIDTDGYEGCGFIPDIKVIA